MKKIKRLLRFSLFLLTVFCLAFLITGSAAIFRPASFVMRSLSACTPARTM